MADKHIFIASGDACGMCEALSGLLVEEGFKPHDNCNTATLNDTAKGSATTTSPAPSHRVRVLEPTCC